MALRPREVSMSLLALLVALSVLFPPAAAP
jgi:hypothetical protein